MKNIIYFYVILLSLYWQIQVIYLLTFIAKSKMPGILAVLPYCDSTSLRGDDVNTTDIQAPVRVDEILIELLGTQRENCWLPRGKSSGWNYKKSYNYLVSISNYTFGINWLNLNIMIHTNFGNEAAREIKKELIEEEALLQPFMKYVHFTPISNLSLLVPCSSYSLFNI